MRCLALAEALRDKNAECLFFLDQGAKSWEEPLRQRNIPVQWLGSEAPQELADRLAGSNTDVLTIDGYEFGEDYQRTLKGSAKALLVLDDTGQGSQTADFILNQNLGFEESEFRGQCRPDCRLLLGPHYALLRPEFVEAKRRASGRSFGPVRQILVTMGGSDTKNVTVRVIQALELLAEKNLKFDVSVIAGRSNENWDRIGGLCREGKHRYHLLRETDRIAVLMLEADMAIGAGGVTNWERLCLGLPSMTIMIADNQKRLTQELENRGLVANLGWHASLEVESMAEQIETFVGDRDFRENIGRKGMDVVDGQGSLRVAEAIL